MGMWQTTNTIVTRYSNFVPVVSCDTSEEALSNGITYAYAYDSFKYRANK